MIRLCTFILSLSVLAACASIVHAQFAVGVGRWGGNNKAATVGESHARGMSDVIRARGEYEMNSAEARLKREEVRSAELDNRMKTAQTYFSMREANKYARFGTDSTKRSQREYNQARFVRHGQEGDPKRLRSGQLDPINGKLSWPVTLMDNDKFGVERRFVDGMFTKRVRNSGYLDYTDYSRLKKTVKAMLATLKEDIRDLDSDDYVEAKRFLNGVLYEAKSA